MILHIAAIHLFVVLQGLAAASIDFYATVLPREKPTTSTSDYYQCTTWDLEAYFMPPSPAGELSSSMLDFAISLWSNPCPKTITNEYFEMICTFPDHPKWCEFASKAPTTLLDGYWSYASSAASWWSATSYEALKTAGLCRNEWYKAMTGVPYGSMELNKTIAYASCFDERQVEPTTSTSAAPVMTQTASSGQKPSASSSEPTQTAEPNVAVQQAPEYNTWVAIGTGVLLATAETSL